MKFRRKANTVLLRLLDPWHRRSRRRVLMMHHGRCGSSVVGLLLNDHPKIYWAGEHFSKSRLLKLRQRNPDFNYLDTIRADEYHAGTGFYGFEIKLKQLQAMGIPKDRFMSEIRVNLGYDYFILIERKNLLRREVSSEIARTTRRFQVPVGKKPELSRIHLNASTLISILEQQMSDVQEMRELLKDVNSLYLSYETEILPDPTIAYQKICTYLNLQYVPTKPKLIRTNPYRLDEIILNFDEVSTVLKGTSYEWMLNHELKLTE